MDKDTLLAFATELAGVAANETLPRFRTGTPITNKLEAGFDPVTEADRAAETALRAIIEQRFPAHGIRGEEFPEKDADGPYRWVLDPIDGTRAFICGAPVWTTLIALERDGRPILGVIDQPFMRERWIGLSGVGDRPSLTVTGALRGHGELPGGASGVEELHAARMMVTDVRGGAYFTDEEAYRVQRLASEVRVLRQGLDSYGFGLLASGQMDLVVEAALHWHDIAAVLPVIEAAGGTACDWQGQPITGEDGWDGSLVLAASAALAEAAVEGLRL